MNWYAIYTKPRQEAVARENLERQDFETYLPMIKSRKRRGNKWRENIEPMFPRYLFIRLEPGTTSVATIRSTRGVTGLVRFGNELVAAPAGFVESLLQTADPQTGIHTHEHAKLREGDSVAITDGPLVNLSGIFKAADGKARAIILLKILGRETELRVPLDQVWRQDS